MNVQSKSRQWALVAATLGVVGFTSHGLAASQTWSATPTDSQWTTAANWVGGAVPGGTNGGTNNATNADVVTFGNPITGTIGTVSDPIQVDLNRIIRSIVFTTNAGPYFIGVPNSANTLILTNTGSITVNADVTSAQTISGPIRVRSASSTNGTYSFINNATLSSATLSFTNPTLSMTDANGRPDTYTLGGTNTGTNTISSAITNAAGVQGVNIINKTGTGTWILSGANTFTGTGATSAANGIQINGGVLSAQNNTALGFNATANTNQVNINNTGTLDLSTGITLDNGLSLNLNDGGTIRSTGSNATQGRINLATAATNATISTVGSGDVFTIGNGTNDFTGGTAGTTVTHIAGPGTVLQSTASNYAGGWSIDSGTLQIGSNTALGAVGTASVTFGAGTTGKLQLNGNSPTIVGLTNNATVGTAAVENGAGGTSTLTVNNAVANTFDGVLRDGTGGGNLSVAKSGPGNLVLTGNNTYTGNTTIAGGALLANNPSGSATGSGTVAVNSTGILGGAGSVAGAVTVASGGHLSPGAGGSGSIGSLGVGSLTLSAGSILDYDIASTASLDKTIVSTSGGLTINGGQLSINGGTGFFTANGVYNLIGYTGTIGGTGTSALSVNGANMGVSNSYVFGSSGGFVTLTVASSGGTVNDWKDLNGLWSTASNWSTGVVPDAAGAFANFGGGTVTFTAPRAVTLNSARTVGTLAFNSPFAVSIAGTGGLTLNNNASASFISDTAGSHSIAVPLTLTTNGVTVTVTSAADTLTASGVISGTSTGMVKNGAGSLVLTGVNTYTGGTTINGGTIQINSADSLGDVSGVLTFNGGSLKLLADVTTSRGYAVNGIANAVIDTNTFNQTVAGTISPVSGAAGGVVKNGLGTLTLQGVNTYTGATTINGGTVSVAANSGLGDTTTGGAINLAGGTLASTASFALNGGASGTADRPIALGTGGGTLAPAAATTLTVSGAITGSTKLTKADAGQVTILTPTVGQNTYSGGTLVSAGTVQIGEINAVNAGLGTGAVTLDGGTLNLRYGGAAIPNVASAFPNNLVVDTGFTGTYIAGGRTDTNGTLTGGGTLNLSVDYVRSNFGGNWSGFTGQINVTNGPNGGEFRINNGNGYIGSKINLAAGVNMYGIVNFAAPGTTYAIGELSGVAGSFLSSGPTAGRTLTWSIGATNTSSQFDGIVRDQTGIAAVTKVGTGTLTLTGANGYSGITTINAGTLAINGQFALGGAVYAGTTFTGGTLQYTAGLTGLNGTGDISQNSGAVAKPVTFTNTATIDTNGNTISYASTVGNAGAGGLTKAGDGTLILAASSYAGGTTVTKGTLQVSTAGGASTPLLANAAGTDIQNGQVVFDYTGDGAGSPVVAIRGFLQGSFTAGAGIMTTGQIHSSTATINRGLGYIDNGTNQVTVKATLFGDADLDGSVTIIDFNALAVSFGANSGKVWNTGDFDYDGAVGINDFNALAVNFGKSLPAADYAEAMAPLMAFAIAHDDLPQFYALTGVPEPTSLGLIAAGAIVGLRRRRRAC